MIHDLDTAEDIVQDVFMKLWHKRDEIHFQKSTQSYLYTMVRNHTLGMIRKADSGQRFYKDLPEGNSHYIPQDIEEEEIEKYLLIDEIYTSIRQLPTKCGEIFTLSKINGLTYTQIAEVLGISVNTVENQIGKALRILRSKLVGRMPILLILMMFFHDQLCNLQLTII